MYLKGVEYLQSRRIIEGHCDGIDHFLGVFSNAIIRRNFETFKSGLQQIIFSGFRQKNDTGGFPCHL